MYINKSPTGDIMSMIEGFDIFNSEFLVKLDLLNCSSQLITKNANRLDLLTYQFYGDWSNYGILGIKNRVIDNSELSIGTELLVPTTEELDRIDSIGG